MKARGPRIERKRRFVVCTEALEARRLFAGGFFDPTFGSGGVVIANTSFPNLDIVKVFALPGDKVLVAGTDSFKGGNVVLERFNADGTPDTSFGDGGHITAGFAMPVLILDAAEGPGGEVFVAGEAMNAASTTPVLAAFNADGSIDAAFGGGKLVLTALGNGDANGVTVRADGRVLFSGLTSTGTGLAGFLGQFTPAGLPDTSFGNNGIAPTALTGPHQRLFLDSAGRVLETEAFGGSGTLSRFLPNGQLDRTFGGTGFVAIPDPVTQGTLSANAIAVQPDGKIIAAGGGDGVVGFFSRRSALPAGGDATVRPFIPPMMQGTVTFAIRFNSDGSLDTSFGKNGIFTPANKFSSFGDDVALMTNGDILVIGADNGATITRLTPAGTPDPKFGGSEPGRPGISTESITPLIGDFDYISGTLAPDGTLLAASEHGVARYLVKGVTLEANGTLAIAGSSGNDTISVTTDGATITATLNGVSHAITAALVKQIVVVAGPGDDDVTIGPGVIGATVLGGTGNDTIVGGDGNDSLRGAAGNDSLVGANGNDTLSGGPGSDTLLGGAGNDAIFAIDGEADSIFGGTGFDAAQIDPIDAVTSVESKIT